MNKLFILLIFLLLSAFCNSQTSVNPDISAVGTFNTFTNFVKGTAEYGKLNFQIPDMELYVEGYLNPYARATVNVAFHEGEFHGEEIFAHIVRGLPLDLQIKAGKYLVGFGKINLTHPHAWSFIYRPLFQQIYFGEEGFNDIGINLSFILPTGDVYTTLDFGINKGSIFEHAHSGEHLKEQDELPRSNSPIFVGRLGSFFSLSDYSNLEIGLSSSYGVHSNKYFNFTGDTTDSPINEPLYFTYAGFDFKYKYRPDSYTALVIQVEGIWNNRDVRRMKASDNESNKDVKEKINTLGCFIYADYRFNKIFSVGAKYDFTYGILGDHEAYNTLSNDDKNKTQGIEGWVGYYPVEETLALRLGVQHLWYDTVNEQPRDAETTIVLQLIFSLGPHKAHPF